MSAKIRTITDMQLLALAKGGFCLSGDYIDANTPLVWRCREGHTFQARPMNVRKGSWCPTCRGITPATIEEMKRRALRKHGKCLSTSYSKATMKLVWECREGHRFEMTPSSVKRGSWCPVCAKKSQRSWNSYGCG